MAGVKGRSGRISNEAMRKRRIEAARLGGLARSSKLRKADEDIKLSKFHAAEFAEQAKKLGVECPETVAEALKFKQLMVAEERRLKLIADRESIEGYRIPIELVDNFMSRLVVLMNRNLDSARSIVEDVPEINEVQRKIIRDRIIGWVERVKTDLSKENLDEVRDQVEQESASEEGALDQPGGAPEPVEEA